MLQHRAQHLQGSPQKGVEGSWKSLVNQISFLNIVVFVIIFHQKFCFVLQSHSFVSKTLVS